MAGQVTQVEDPEESVCGECSTGNTLYIRTIPTNGVSGTTSDLSEEVIVRCGCNAGKMIRSGSRLYGCANSTMVVPGELQGAGDIYLTSTVSAIRYVLW